MDPYEWIQSNAFILFVITFVFFMNWNNPKALFFLFAALSILMMFYYKSIVTKETNKSDIDQFVDKVEKSLSKEVEIPDDRIFYFHKTPINLRYLNRANDLKAIMYDLKMLAIFDRQSLEKIMSYLEHFLKLHYKMMMGKYDFNTNFPILRDTRNDLLNAMKAIYYNIPKVSNLYKINDIDAYMEERIALMQAKTNRYLRSVYHKYQPKGMIHEAPYENDKMKNEHYHMF
jgi:hypothetical protein